MKTDNYLYIMSLIEELKTSIRGINQKIETGKFHECQEIIKSSQQKIEFITIVKQDYLFSQEEIDKIDMALDFCNFEIKYMCIIINLYMRMLHMEDEIVLLRYGLDNIHMRLLIVCGEGISSSFIVNHVAKYADKEDIIRALPITMLREHIDEFDVVLVAPHLRHKEIIVQKTCTLHNKAYGVIDASVYGKMDGIIILKQAKELYIHLKKLRINSSEMF